MNIDSMAKAFSSLIITPPPPQKKKKSSTEKVNHDVNQIKGMVRVFFFIALDLIRLTCNYKRL